MISNKDLKRSAVVFSEEAHTYRRGEVELSGITGLIHSVLLLGVYPEASQYVKEVQIPKAGYYGTCVHKAIQAWDELGIENTQFPEVRHTTKHCGDVIFPAHDVSEELLHYRKVKPRKCRTIANEFTVDFGMYASQIDCIWADDEDNIYLVDHKTNNLNYYPGGAAGLQEYLSWQLSCYAVMFEAQTGLKVKGLLGNWMRKGAGELWRITRQPDDQVIKLLNTQLVKGDFGFVYVNDEMQVTAAKVEEVKPTLKVISSADMHAQNWVIPQADAQALVTALEAIAEIKRQADEAEARCQQLKDKLKEAMESAGIKSWDTGIFKATVKAASTRKTFDSKKFQADHPDMYQEYIKESETKSSIIITLSK